MGDIKEDSGGDELVERIVDVSVIILQLLQYTAFIYDTTRTPTHVHTRIGHSK